MPLGESANPHPRRSLTTTLGDMLRPHRQLLPLGRLAGPSGPAEAAVRALALAVPMAGNTLLCRTLGRYKVLVDAADFTHAPHLAMDGFWEWWTTRFLATQLRPGETVVDGGACYGYFSLLAADLVGPGGRVVAFEPNPRMATLLRRNLALNGMETRVSLHEAALAGPIAGRPLHLAVPDSSPMNAHLLPEELATGIAEAGPGGGMALVATTTLDQVAGLRPDFVKLDIGGAEEAAWAGMQGLVAANPALRVLLRFNPDDRRQPAGFLESLAAAYPLRRLASNGAAQHCTIAEALAGGDVMLYLARD